MNRASSARRLIRTLALALWIGAAMPAGAASLPTFTEVRQSWQSSDAWLLDRHGEPLQRQRIDPTVRRLDWIALEDVSPALRAAIVLSEDKHFYQHSGVDWTAVAATSFRNLFNQRTRGASTLTMQLAGLLEPALKRGAGNRTLAQKIDQAWMASALEHDWKKDQILEAYLNLVPFRGELVGIDAVSQSLFGKQPSGLNAQESALLAALLRGPNAPPDTVARRACGVRAAIADATSQDGPPLVASALGEVRTSTPATDCVAMEGYARLVLARRAGLVDARATAPPAQLPPLSPHLAPHLARQLLKTPGQHLASTLEARVQRVATQALDRHLAALAARNVEDGAVLVLDNRSGEVLAWVGSSGARSSAAAVDGVTALRQAGSTLKPFVYQLALEQRLLTAASILDDAQVDLSTAAGLYIPQNYDHAYKGPISLRAALGSSLNIPAVRTLVMVTPDRLFERMRALDFDSLKLSGDYYGYSLALGSADISLLALTNAYRSLANGGMHSKPLTRRWQSSTPHRVADAAASFVIADILADRNARALTFGTENVLATRMWTAVKTGTSKDMRDNWCIGFSDRYTVGVWVGNFSGAPMWDVSGVSGAAPVWADVMAFLHRGEASRPPAAPAGLVQADVGFASGREPARREWFLRGTELATITPADGAQSPLAIRAPLDRSLFALDPDIPGVNQRLTFEAGGQGARAAQWRLDGRSIGTGDTLQWPPMPGPHRLELVRAGQVVDHVRFEVRGANFRKVSAVP